MSRTNCSYKWGAIVIISFSSLFWVKLVNAAPPPGFDFTVVADAPYKQGELLVRFAPKDKGKLPSAAEKMQIIDSLGGGIIERDYKIVPGLSIVKLPCGQTVKDALKTFNNTNGIRYAEPNYKIKLFSTFPNDLRFDELWGMHNVGQTGGTQNADIDAPEAWEIATGSDIIVAVLDTGVNYAHPDLADNIWVNPGEIPNNGIDDDGNGFVDDIYGYDFADNNNDPNDYLYHGTHCAGTIGAIGNNVNEFTLAGLASGVYDGLEPNNFNGWGKSYHNIFPVDSNSSFVPFELGGDGDANDIITVAGIVMMDTYSKVFI